MGFLIQLKMRGKEQKTGHWGSGECPGEETRRPRKRRRHRNSVGKEGSIDWAQTEKIGFEKDAGCNEL